MEQLNTPVAQYSVSYSIDGGKEWIAGPAECAQSPCTIKDLPAGTNALVKVNAWGQAGEGEPSEYVAAQTEDSDYSRECRETLLAKADGSYVAPGTVPPPNPNPNPPRSLSPTREHTRKHAP